MATVLVTADFTTAGVANNFAANTLTWVMAGVERISTGGNGAESAVGAANVAARIDGTVYGEFNGLMLQLAQTVSVEVGAMGQVLAHLFDGIITGGANSSVINHGLISAASNAIEAGAAGFSLNNFGTIVGDVSVKSDGAFLNNAGQIGGSIFLVLGAGTGARVVNTGTITAEGVAIDCSASNDSVINRGTIFGSVQLGGGNDLFDGEGGASTFQFGVKGGAGQDILRGSSFADSFNGEADADVLLGLGGDDFLTGDAGTDTIRGGGGEDALLGGSENDRLFGGGDDDTLIGGTGADRMTGGSGADYFAFASGAEIGLTAGARDRIEDFASKVDKIDLSGIAGLSFIDTAAFGSVAGQVRYAKTLGQLQFDLSGDGVADAILDLGAGTILLGSDLILA